MVCFGAGRNHRELPGAVHPAEARSSVDPLHKRGGADADGRSAGPRNRRTYRDAFCLFRTSGLFVFLSGLEGPGDGDDSGRARSYPARNVLAAVDVWSAFGSDLETAGTFGLGNFRGCISGRLYSPRTPRSRTQFRHDAKEDIG